MNGKMSILTLAILLAAVLGVATSSIATECYNYPEPGKKLLDTKQGNYIFVIVNLVCNIFMVLLSFFCMYLSITSE